MDARHDGDLARLVYDAAPCSSIGDRHRRAAHEHERPQPPPLPDRLRLELRGNGSITPDVLDRVRRMLRRHGFEVSVISAAGEPA